MSNACACACARPWRARYSGLHGCGWEVFCEPAGGNFLWARPPGMADSRELTRLGERYDIALAPGNFFRPGGETTPWVRINAAYVEEPRPFLPGPAADAAGGPVSRRSAPAPAVQDGVAARVEEVDGRAERQPDQKATQVSGSRCAIRNTQKATDSSGTTGTPGQRKARGRSGRVRRSTSTAIEISEKADSVPILISSASTASGTKAAISAKTMPTVRGEEGRGVDRMHRRQPGRQQSVARHGEDDAGLAIGHHQITVVMPTMAPRSTKPATQFSPATCKASETGWSMPAKRA